MLEWRNLEIRNRPILRADCSVGEWLLLLRDNPRLAKVQNWWTPSMGTEMSKWVNENSNSIDNIQTIKPGNLGIKKRKRKVEEFAQELEMFQQLIIW